MQQAAPGHGTQEAQRGEIRVHPDGGTVITARMPSAEERARGYPDGEPVLVVTRPDGRSMVFAAGMASVVIGDREATADQARDAARSVLGEIAGDLDSLQYKLGQFSGALGRSPGSVVTLAAELAAVREHDYCCEGARICPRPRTPPA